MSLFEYTSSPSSTLPESFSHTPPITPRCIHVTKNQDPCVSPSVDSGDLSTSIMWHSDVVSAPPGFGRQRSGDGQTDGVSPVQLRAVGGVADMSAARKLALLGCVQSKPLSSLAQSAASASWASEDAVWHRKTPMSDLDPYGSCCHLMRRKKKGENSRVCRFYNLHHAHYKVKHPDEYLIFD
ncbi:hypothetical protein DFH11DRAFT_1883192, partial [Phellopilus nigrolimitatus]